MRIAFAFCLSLLGAAPAAAATISIYDQRADFQAAIAGSVTEDFEDGSLVQGLTMTGYQNISGGAAYAQTRSTRPPLVFTFADSIYGFGWLAHTAGLNAVVLTLGFADGSEQVLAPWSEVPTEAFRGFTSDMGIKSVSVTSQNQVQLYVHDLTFGTVQVPEPSALANAGAALALVGGLAALRRRRAAAAV